MKTGCNQLSHPTVTLDRDAKTSSQTKSNQNTRSIAALGCSEMLFAKRLKLLQPPVLSTSRRATIAATHNGNWGGAVSDPQWVLHPFSELQRTFSRLFGLPGCPFLCPPSAVKPSQCLDCLVSWPHSVAATALEKPLPPRNHKRGHTASVCRLDSTSGCRFLIGRMLGPMVWEERHIIREVGVI